MKRIISSFVCVCLIFSCCFAENTSSDVEMTLDEIVEYTLKNNSTLIDLEKNNDKQKDLYDDAKDEYRIWQNKIKSGGYSFEDSLEYLNCWGYSLELAKLQYDSFLVNKLATKLQIEYAIKNMIYSYFEMGDTIELLEKTIQKQENDVEIAEVKYRLNMVTEIDVNSAKTTLETSKLQLKELKESLELLIVSLKQLMGYDVNKELLIKRPEYISNSLDIEELESIIDKSLETNKSILASRIQYKQKENNYILATKTSFLLKEDKRDAKKDYSDAEFRLNNDIKVIKEKLVKLYNEVKNKEQEVVIAKDELEKTKIQFEQAKVMFEIGMISKNSYNSYEIALISSENKYKSKQKEEVLLKDRWNVAISVGDIIEK